MARFASTKKRRMSIINPPRKSKILRSTLREESLAFLEVPQRDHSTAKVGIATHPFYLLQIGVLFT